MSRRRELIGSVGLAVGSLLTCLLAAELSLRALAYRPERHQTRIRLTNAAGDDLTVRKGAIVLDCYPSDPYHLFPIDLRRDATRRRYEAAGVRGFERVPEFPYAVEFRYNSLGFRGTEYPARRPGVRRVAVVGDSFTEGQGVREELTVTGELQRLLNRDEPGSWEVVNLGWRARDLPKLRESFDVALGLDPDVVVYGMVLNDGERSQEFDAQWPELNDWIMVRRPPERPSLLRPRLVSFVRDRLETRRIARDTERWYRDMYGAPNGEGWGRTREDLRAMKQAAQERGVPMLVALWPLLVDLERDYPFADVHAKIGRACERIGVPFQDLQGVLRGRPTASLWVHPADWHPNAAAHRLVAEALAPRVRELAAAR